MPTLSPFVALRYGRAAGGASELLAPPYDVIDDALAAELRKRSPYNAVRLVLPEGPAPERYERAAGLLRQWLADGILTEDPEAVAYSYRQSFAWNGRAVDRRALFAALELTPFDGGEVLPHEETHAGPKRDRLALTLACRAQLSSVFLIAHDPGGSLAAGLVAEEELSGPVLDAETPDGVRHHLWRIGEATRAGRLCALGGAHPLLMADGHHRYETALAARAALPDLEPADAVLACIASDSDPGLFVLPTHRSVVGRAGDSRWAEALSTSFEIEPLGAAGPEEAATRAAAAGGPTMAFVTGGGTAGLLRALPGAIAEADIAAGEAEVASVLFDRLVLGGALHTTADDAAAAGLLAYSKEPADALAAAGSEGAAFLLPPLDVGTVRRSVQATGRRLPAKSTYFAPKIPSGLLFRPL